MAEMVPTVVGDGARFEGVLTFRGAARVDGELDGDVIAEGRLVLGPRARVRARIEVDELVVAGDLEGDVAARHRVELLPGARLAGSVSAPRLAVAEGARLEGRCRTGEQAATAPSPAPAGAEAERKEPEDASPALSLPASGAGAEGLAGAPSGAEKP